MVITYERLVQQLGRELLLESVWIASGRCSSEGGEFCPVNVCLHEPGREPSDP